MPQVFQVLKCYKCSVFQIHQTKKSNKFECKMCGEKQSIKRHYGIGTGKDCRMHVQKLNLLKGNIETKYSGSNSDEEYKDNKIDENIPSYSEKCIVTPSKCSKWSEFMDKEEEETTVTEEPMFLGDNQVLLEGTRKRKFSKLKAKAIKSDTSLFSSNNTSKLDLEPSYGISNKNNIDNLEPGKILFHVQDNAKKTHEKSDSCRKQLTSNNFNNLMAEKCLRPVFQTINKNSKWVQFIESEEDKEKNNNDVLSSHDTDECNSISGNLFSLCDDSELDKILDI